jgi:hypothetical protein
MQNVPHITKYTITKPSAAVADFVFDADLKEKEKTDFVDSGLLSIDTTRTSDTVTTVIKTFKDSQTAGLYKAFCMNFNGGHNASRLQEYNSVNNITVVIEQIS